MTDLVGVAAVLGTVLTPVSVVALAWINNRNSTKVRETVEAEHVQSREAVAEVLAVAVQVDHAVNGKAPGEASISQDITTIKDKQEHDSPSVVATPENGKALIPMVDKLTRLVEKLLEEKETI